MPAWEPKPTKNYDSNILTALKDARDHGLSFRLCGIEFGMTTNQVAGLCWRQGLSVPKPEPTPPAPLMHFPDIGLCLWADADPRDGFCGQPAVPNSAYCETHHRRVFIKPPRAALGDPGAAAGGAASAYRQPPHPRRVA